MPDASPFADELRAGLRSRPRAVAPKWFYDEAGSRLFERICELPEYYPTRTEMALLDQHAPALAACIGADAEIVEFGAGASRKVQVLLAALRRPVAFVPVDISGEHLAAAAERLRVAHPGLIVRPLVGDYLVEGLQLPPPAGRRVGFYPGSSIGNFEPPQAVGLLQRYRRWLQGGGLLIGVDLVKPKAVLEAAYDDGLGVTGAFNLNLLRHLNRLLGADFDLRQWQHVALYDEEAGRIEMHLQARAGLTVRWPGASRSFAPGERIHTENSYKWRPAAFEALLRDAGYAQVRTWTDPQAWFAVMVAQG